MLSCGDVTLGTGANLYAVGKGRRDRQAATSTAIAPSRAGSRSLRVIRRDLLVEPEDEIERSGQVRQRFANRGELLKVLAVFDGLHLHDGGNRGSDGALKHLGGHESALGGNPAKHLVEMFDGIGLVCRIDLPDVGKNGAFLHRRTSLLELDATGQAATITIPSRRAGRWQVPNRHQSQGALPSRKTFVGPSTAANVGAGEHPWPSLLTYVSRRRATPTVRKQQRA